MSLINQGYKVGAPSNNLILETAGRVYVKVGDRFYEWDFRNQKPSAGSSVTNITNNISEEVDLSNYVDKSKLQTVLNNYVTRREWADVKKSQQMLEQAQLEGFTGSISPITVNTMQLIVGSDQLQFEFIQDKSHDNVIRHDFSVINNRIHCAAGVIKHYTLYGPGEIRPENNDFDNLPYYYRWNVSEFNEMLFDDNKSYYLYIRAEKPSTDNDTLNRDVTNASSGKYDIKVGNATFVLSSNAIGLEDEDDYYHFLYALIGENSNGYRSTSTMNGFTEITPGQVTAYLFKSADGNSYLDFKNNQLVLRGSGNNGNHLIWQNGQLSIKGNITVSDGHNESPADLYRGAWTSGETYYNGNTVSYNNGTSTSLYKLSGVGDNGEVASDSNKPGASGSNWTLVISGGSGTSAYSVDLSNEYLAIPVVNGHPVKEWSVVVNAFAYVGTVSDTITRISNGNSWPSGINFSWTQNHSDFTITITTSANISNTVVLPVKIRSNNHSSYTTLNFTIAPVEGSFIYSIEPSSSSIKYTSGASITCNVYKQSVNGGSRTILAGMDVTGTIVDGVKNGLFYTLGTGNRDSYTYGTSISITDVDKITFEYFIDNILYDLETVPIVKDGASATSPYTVDLSNEAVSIPVNTSGEAVNALTIETIASAQLGSESQNIISISIGNDSQSPYTDPSSGIDVTWDINTGIIIFNISKGDEISSAIQFPITITSSAGTSTAIFTIIPVPGEDIYSIEPSESSIKYTTGITLTCTVYKESVYGGDRVQVNSSDWTDNPKKTGLFYKKSISDNFTLYNSGIQINSGDNRIYLYYFIDDVLYDQESVPVVKDGVDGSTVNSVDISASSYIIWYADNTASAPETTSIVLNPRTNVSGTGSWTFKNSSQNAWNDVNTGVSNNVLTIDSNNIGTFFGNIAYNQGTKSCEFKYTITFGSNSYSDIVNILKACSGKDGVDGSGANAVRIDLTNENAQMLYTSGGSKMTQNVYTKWSLYDGNSDVSNNISSVAISGNNVTCTLSDNTSTIPSTAITNPTTNPGTYRYIYITGIDSNANDGYVDVTVTYNNGTNTSQHTSRFNVRKVVGKNLYELILTPDAFSVNDSTVGSSDQGSITVQIKETNGITGAETIHSAISIVLTDLYVYYSINGGNPSQWTSGSISFTKISTNSIQFFLLNAAYNASTYTEHVVDAETIVVNHMSNGTNGYTTGIATLFVESATKPDWDDLFTTYDLESLTYNINSKCLTEYTINGTDHLITWVDNCATIQMSQSVSLIIYKNYTENITAGNSLWVSQGPYSILSGNEDPISYIEWSPFVQAENVKINSAFVSLYRRAQSLTSSDKPKSDSNNYWTYNFVNGALTPTGSDDWSATIPSITDANPYPVWISQGVASSSNTTDIINSWSDPVKYVDSNYVFILTNSNHGLDCASNGDLIGQSQSFSTQIWAHYNKVLLGTDFTYYLQIPNDIPHCEIKVPEGVTYYTGQSTGTTDANNRTLNKYYKYAIDKNTDITFIINGDIGNVSVDSEILIYLNSDDASPYYKLTETIFKQFRGETGSKGNSVVARIFNWDDVANNTKFYDGTELLNDDSSIYPQDYVYKAVSNGNDPPIYTYYWKCTDSHTKGSSNTDPRLGSDYWAAESSFPFVASKVLFVGNQADGWVMDEGRIYHTNGLIEFNNEGNINLNKYSIKCKMYEYDASYAGYSQDCGWEYINGAESYNEYLYYFLQEIVENCNNFLIGHALSNQSYGTFENFKYILNGLETDPSLVFESNIFSISDISLSQNEEYIIITLYDNAYTSDNAAKFYFKTLLDNNEPVINSYIHNTTCLNSSGLTTSNIKINDGNITVANVFTANNDGAVIAKGGLDGNNWYIKADNLNIQNNTSIQNVPSYRQDIKVYEQDIKTDDSRGIVWNVPPVHLFRRNITNTETLQFPDLYFSDMGSPGGIWKCRWWILIFDGVDVKIKGVNYTGLRTGGSQYNTIVHTNINDSFTINDLYIDTNNKSVYYALRDISSNANLTNDFKKICDYSGTCETNDVSHHDLWNRNVRTYTFVKGSSVSRSNCEAKVLCCVNAGVDWNFGDNYYWFKVYTKDPVLITGGDVNKQMTISSNGISSIINNNSYLIFKDGLFNVKAGNYGLQVSNSGIKVNLGNGFRTVYVDNDILKLNSS